jgi:hydroxyacylglutathione hydrolase
MLLRQIFDPYLAQYAYLVGCQRTGEALVIDPERDIDQYQKLAAENGLRITAVAETHIHADFVSGGRQFAQDPALHLYLSDEGGPDWTYKWTIARPNTHLLKDGDIFMVGNIRVEAIHTPGHTPEHVSYLITDLGSGANEPIALATGDFLFVGDVGRPDLLETAAGVENVMEPSARTLCASLRDRLTSFSDFLQILPAHGAGSACGKSLGAVPTTTLGYERRFNSPFKLSVQDGDAFVKEILQGQPDPPLYFATMKRVNRDGAAVTNGLPSPAHCTNDDLEQSLADRSIRILDTRTNQESFNNKHITRSITAPLRSPFFSSAAGSFLAEQDKIFLVVEDPKDVELAVRQLYRIGFDNVVGWVTVREAQEHGSMNERTERVQFANFDADKALQQGAIVDVRATSEFQLSHIKGAYSLPYTRMRELLTALPKDKKLFVHCASGKRASLATSFLCARGYDAVLIDGNYSEHMPSCRISSSLPS